MFDAGMSGGVQEAAKMAAEAQERQDKNADAEKTGGPLFALAMDSQAFFLNHPQLKEDLEVTLKVKAKIESEKNH